MEKKRLTKTMWYGSDVDHAGNAILPEAAASDNHLSGLNEGEIYIHNHPSNPSIWTRTTDGKIVSISGVDISVLEKLFLSKTKDDRSKGKISSDKAIEVGNYVSGASGAIIYKDAENGQTVAEFDKLYVRMKAYFETLEIINVNTIGGKQIISPAGSVKCIGVEETDNAYRCYFLAEQDGEKVQNRFLVNDQIYSQMFDAVEGTSQNVSTHYFWRLCIAKSKEPVTFENKSCHYIDLSKTDCDKDSDVPMVGDVLNQRGNRTDLDRMNFIEMSSVDAFSPNITLFHGVNSYSLDGKAYVSYGVDKSTNKAFMDVYGDMYVGDRQNSSYMRYTQENGLEISGTLSIGTKLGDTPLKDLISASSPEGYQEFVQKVTQDIEGLQAQIDGAIESYFYQYDPTLGNYPASDWVANGTEKAHLNDTFTNLSSGYSWRWSFDGSTYKWVEITDTATTKALALAGQAKDTADGKRRVFIDTPYPPYDKGDLWSRGSEHPLMICVKEKDKNGAYEASDFDYADNNAKLKEEMQELVGATKDELNNAIGQAKNEAVNNANAYTDEGKKALQASIDAMESSKANLDDVYTRAQADGKISDSETKAINAAKEQADAAIALSEVTIKAYADGIVDKEEAARIKQAQENLDTAKKYAEEQAQQAIDEANNTYGYLAKALGTEVDGGLLLTSLIQMRDTDQNIMSGINGLTAKGDKSIATWWGGGMHDMFDYYDWDGAKWVAKKNIQIPSNVPSGVIRMDGTGYLAKGKFWWDESGKIYADPTALFLMFDVEDESASLSQTILAMRDKQTEFESMWEFKTDANGRKYLLSKYPLVTQEGVTMYSGASTTIPSIYDGLPIDGTTIYWENGVLKAQGGGSEGINEEQLENYLNTNNYAKKSDIPSLSGYATQTWVASQGYITGITSAMVTSALGFTPYNADNFTKAKIKSTLGISDWALAASKPSYNYTEIGGTPDLSVYALKTSLSSYQPLISTTNKLAYSLVSGTPTSLKNPTALTFGSKTYDGSEAKTINASDLGALTIHQTIYELKLQSGTFSADTYTPNSAAKTINIPTTTAHISESGNLYFTNARAVSALSSTLASYVTLSGSQIITGAKNFTGGLSVNGGSLVYNASEGYWKLEGNLLVTGGIAMYSDGSNIEGGGTGGSIDYPLKWSGFSSGSFDGSAAKTIYIPSKLSELTNDSGYALSSALSGYLPLSGGVLSVAANNVLSLNSTIGYPSLEFRNNGAILGRIVMGDVDGSLIRTNAIWSESYVIWDAKNFNPSDYLPKSGGTLTGVLTLSSGYDKKLILDNTDNESKYQYISFRQNGTEYGTLGTSFDDNLLWNQNYILHSKNYSSYALPLSGGRIDGASYVPLQINSTNTSVVRSSLYITHNGGDKAQIGWDGHNGWGTFLFNYSSNGVLGITDSGTPYFGVNGYELNTLIHSGNYSNYALPLTGGTISGNLYIGDSNNTDWMPIRFRRNGVVTFIGQGPESFDVGFDNGYLTVGPDRLLYIKSSYQQYDIIHSGNIGSQSVSYASSAGNSSLFGGLEPAYYCNWLYNTRMNLNDIRSGVRAGKLFGATNSISDSDAGYRGFLEYGSDGYTAQFNSDSLGFLYYRWCENSQWIDWRQIAFTTSKVASAFDSDTLGGLSSSDFARARNDVWGNEVNFLGYSYLGHGWDYYGPTITFGQDAYYGRIQKLYDSNRLFLSGYNQEAGELGVREFAFTDSNVASATKLQTARTIWGQSFDGTGNVSGKLILDDTLAFSGKVNVSYETYINNVNQYGLRIYYSNGNEGIMLKQDGNVGIGTTSPLCKLDVSGEIHASGNAYLDGGSIFAKTYLFMNTDAEGIYFGTNGLSWHNSSNTWTQSIQTYQSNGTTTFHGEIAFNAGYSIQSYNNAPLYINKWGNNIYLCETGGNVSIGTSESNYKLQIAGDLGVNSSINLYSGDQINGYNGIAFNYNLSKYVNVSIYDGYAGRIAHFVTGGITFDKSLSIYSSLYVDSTSTFTGKTNHNGGLESTVSSAYAIYGNSSTSRVCIAGDNGKSLYIASKGNSADYYLVSVNYGQTTLGSGGSNAFTIRGDGNVGIGQNAPSAKLHVAGNILTSGSITMNSMRSMKNIINENGLSLEELSTIKPTRFTWKDGRDDRIHVGGIADDVMKVLPEVVFKGNDGVLSMDYASAAFVMAASLIQPMTEHERRIANLERENALLKEEIRNLKSA